MKEPIKAGDMAEVIAGLGNQISPNLGLIVKVVSAQGEHSRFGRIWRCEGEGIKQMHDSGGYIVMGWADFAQDWLKKIEPPPAPGESTTTTRELETHQ